MPSDHAARSDQDGQPAQNGQPDQDGQPGDPPHGRPLHVRIAVLTYRRPDDIAAALPRLVAQAASVTSEDVLADVVVVDNDPDAGARSFVTGFGAGASVPVHYEHEPVPGISAGRNRALSSADGVDLLVFIDDDERPSERWLALLLQTWREHRCAAVVGSVVSDYEVPPDPWVQAGRFFDRRRLPTGTRVEVAATNNLLLDLEQIRALGLEFDPAFGITGGGDTMFSRTLHARGGVLIWNDEAVVTDAVPAARVTRDWVLKRAFRSGSSWSATSLKLAPTVQQRVATRARLTARGGVRVVGGAARTLLGTLTRSAEHQAKGRRTLARGAGMVSGAWGHVYSEYRRS